LVTGDPEEGPARRLLVLSSRPDLLAAVVAAAKGLEPSPLITNLLGPAGSLGADDLVLVDVGEPAATFGFLRARLGTEARLVAVLDGAWVDRFRDALAGDWYDYLFFPISPPELGLVWQRHVGVEAVPELSLDVGEDGTIRLSFPSEVAYQRPAVERIVEAGRHLAGLDADAAFRVRVALGEAVANAILYGSGPGTGGLVHIEMSAREEVLDVRVRDEGEGFDRGSVPDPTSDVGVARASGRGLFMMRRVADALSFNDAGNEVSLVFKGMLHPVRRLAPVLESFAETTGLAFRVEHVRLDRTDLLHDSLGEGTAETDLTILDTAIGADEILRVTCGRLGPGERPGSRDLLDRLLEAVVETDEARERWVQRRLRRERVLAELEVARDLQLRLLPSADKFRDLADVAARCDPALSLGGDFYFLSRLSRGRLGLMLGDVSSHGPSAALIMALTLSAAALVAKGDASAAEVLDGMRDQLLAALESTEMYMTLFYAVADPARQTLVYANAGHPYAYRLDATGHERLAALDPPIGMGSAPGYQEKTIAWPGGSGTLLTFTDGLTADLADPLEAPGPELARLLSSGDLDPSRLVEALFADAIPGMRLDDRTALAVRP
jgi:serine phosphatase RsbU (regulator of sigma subunit)/anti-sigma regulatory factor (Ser/Thr protein kinase)